MDFKPGDKVRGMNQNGVVTDVLEREGLVRVRFSDSLCVKIDWKLLERIEDAETGAAPDPNAETDAGADPDPDAKSEPPKRDKAVRPRSNK